MARVEQGPLLQTSAARWAVGSILVALILAGGFYYSRRSGDDPLTYGNDFSVYYFAAAEVADGRDPYERRLGTWVPYLYPPLLAELMLPLAFLPLQVAAYIWFLLSATALLYATWMSVQICQPGGGWTTEREAKIRPESESTTKQTAVLLSAAALLIVARFALSNFELGQVNNIVAALSIGHVYLWSRGKRGLSAVALAVAVSLKLIPALLILLHIAKGRFRFAAVCSVVATGLLIASFAPFGSRAPGTFREFVNRTVKNEQGFDLSYSGNQSLRGALARLHVSSNPDSSLEQRNPFQLITFLVSILLIAIAVAASRLGDSEAAGAAPFFCCSVLLSPLAWKTHFVLLILPLTYAAQVAIKSRAAFKRRLALSVLVIAFVLFNLSAAVVIGQPASEWADTHSLVFAGAFLVYLLVSSSKFLTARTFSLGRS